MHTFTRRGFSLVEINIVAAVFGGLLAVFTLGQLHVERHARNEVGRSSQQILSSSVFDRLLREVAPARIETPMNGSSLMNYQLGVDHDGNGSVLDGNGLVTWGMVVGGVPTLGANGTVLYVKDGELSEVDEAADLNGDGDSTDVFDIGHLERRLPNGAVNRLSGPWILQPFGNWGDDVDGDGEPDPLFWIDDTGRLKLLNVDITAVTRLPDATWARYRYQTDVTLVNDS